MCGASMKGNKNKKTDYKRRPVQKCTDVLASPPSFLFFCTKHLWICNDVYMHFSSNTKSFGLSSHRNHVNKRVGVAADSRSNSKHLELNQLQWDQPDAARNAARPTVFKQHTEHLQIKKGICSLISSQMQKWLVHQKAFARWLTVVIIYSICSIYIKGYEAERQIEAGECVLLLSSTVLAQQTVREQTDL